MTAVDVLHRFELERAGVRGALVLLERSWHDLRAHADYPEHVAGLLGEAVAASALFTSTIKFAGRLSVQLQGGGALRLLFAECTHDGSVRGIARWAGPPPLAPVSLEADARLAITIENRITDTRYQGLVPVEGSTLARAFEQYFDRSEQLPTRIALAQGGGRCAGLMLQKVALDGGSSVLDEDGWNRAQHLFATLTAPELLELAPETVLLRLFHEEGVRLQPAQPIAFACTCSRERVEAMLRSLGRDESEATLAEQGSIEVHCEFCNRRYVFDENDIAEVFASDDPQPPVATRH